MGVMVGLAGIVLAGTLIAVLSARARPGAPAPASRAGSASCRPDGKLAPRPPRVLGWIRHPGGGRGRQLLYPALGAGPRAGGVAPADQHRRGRAIPVERQSAVRLLGDAN